MDHDLKMSFTIFEDRDGYWMVPSEKEKLAIEMPSIYRGEVFKTKISACRKALSTAIFSGAKELHLHGFGSTANIKRESKANGVKPFIYWPSIETRIAEFIPGKQIRRSR